MKLRRLPLFALAAAILLPAATALSVGSPEDDAKIIRYQKVFYPEAVCAVSGEPAEEGEELIDVLYEGRLVRFCCTMCQSKLDDPEQAARFLADLDAKIVADQTPRYPIETCIVSGEKLGSMGDPIDVVYQNRVIRLCCKGCKKAFKKDPAKVLTDLDAAIIEQGRANSGLEKCVVSGEALGSMGDPVERVYGVEYVSLCCKGCVKQFEKDSTQYMAKVREAKKKAAAEKPAEKQG